jgi:Bacterial Ig-like domain (group 3)/FG-GAP-like repeat
MKSTKALSLAVLLIFCTGTSHVLAQETHVSPKMPTRADRRLDHPLVSFRSSKYIATHFVRPMAAPPTGNLPPATSRVGFQTTTLISVGNNAPLVSVVGDFNGDGKQDIASIVQDELSQFWLSVILSNGDGTFQAPVQTAVSFNANGSPDLLAAADLNGDGKCDVVLAHANSVDVLIGDGTGNFSTAVNYVDTITIPAALALADANGDSKIDIVVASGSPDGTGNSPVATFAGDGTGVFGAATTTHYPAAVNSGILVDVNADGHLDLVSQSELFLGSSSDFGTGVSLSSANSCGTLTGSVAVADLGNGHPDIVTADCGNGTITVFLGDGAGSFGTGTTFSAGHQPGALTLADVNGDGNIDAVVSDFYSMDVMVLLGNGDGTFVSPSLGYPAGGNIWTAALVSKFGANVDVVIPSMIPDEWASLVYLRNVGVASGSVAAPNDYFDPNGTAQSGADTYGIATADLNGDGLPDFVVGNLSLDPSVGVAVFLSNSATKELTYNANYGSGGMLEYLALADIDGDGKLDLVAANADPTQGNLLVFRGNGNGTFQSTPVSIRITSAAGLGHLVVLDLNKDSKPDVAVLDTIGNVWILLNRSTPGTVSFGTATSVALTNTGSAIAAADLGRGMTDIVITQTAAAAVSILFNDGSGGFTPQVDFDLGSMYPVGLALGATTAAGSLDLVVAIDDSDAGMGIAVAIGNGDGTFGVPVLYPATSDLSGGLIPFPQEVRVADLDGDGNPDIVFTNAGDGTVGVLYGTGQSGSGTSPFYSPIEFRANDYPQALLLADVNGDGALDAVVGGGNYSGVTTLLNTGANQITIASNLNPSNVNQNVTFTATVTAAPVPGGATQTITGTVTFYDGSTSLGSGTISGGIATLTTQFNAQGPHLIFPAYSGDTNYVGNKNLITNPGVTLVQNVVQGSGTPRYTLSATPSTATLSPGESTQFTITATPIGGDTETINFSCLSLPQDVSCAFSPTGVTLNGSTPSFVTLTVTVSPTAIAANSPPQLKGSFSLAAVTIGIVGWVTLLSVRRTRGKMSLVVVMITLALILASMGCSNSVGSTVGTPKIIQVKATGNGGNSDTQQLNLTLNIVQ